MHLNKFKKNHWYNSLIMINNKNNNNMTTEMPKFNFELPVKANIALNNYKTELKQKETQ